MVEDVEVERLIKHPMNPREGDIGAIASSIQRNGWFGTVVAQVSTNHVLAGNHRLQAAKMLGFKTVPVYWVDCDDETAVRMLLADNRTSDLATYNVEQLSEILTDLMKTDDLFGTGYDGDDLDVLLKEARKLPPDFPEMLEPFTHRCPSCSYTWQTGAL
jgi:ParB-like chromosome segregation protein Spo0J